MDKKFTREFKVLPAYYRAPQAGESIGASHCAELQFVVKGPNGAMVLRYYTEWYKPESYAGWKARGLSGLRRDEDPEPTRLEFHKIHPHDPEVDREHNQCDYLDGRNCYGSSTGILDEFKGVLISLGCDAIFDLMEEKWDEAMKMAPEHFKARDI